MKQWSIWGSVRIILDGRALVLNQVLLAIMWEVVFFWYYNVDYMKHGRRLFWNCCPYFLVVLTHSFSVFSSQPFRFIVGEHKREFIVHEAALTILSERFTALTNGELREANNRVVEVEYVDEHTFVRFCELVSASKSAPAELDLNYQIIDNRFHTD